MVLKTFNVDAEIHKKFSEFCKEHGISMSKQVELFMDFFLADGRKAKELLEKLERMKRV